MQAELVHVTGEFPDGAVHVARQRVDLLGAVLGQGWGHIRQSPEQGRQLRVLRHGVASGMALRHHGHVPRVVAGQIAGHDGQADESARPSVRIAIVHRHEPEHPHLGVKDAAAAGRSRMQRVFQHGVEDVAPPGRVYSASLMEDRDPVGRLPQSVQERHRVGEEFGIRAVPRVEEQVQRHGEQHVQVERVRERHRRVEATARRRGERPRVNRAVPMRIEQRHAVAPSPSPSSRRNRRTTGQR